MWGVQDVLGLACATHADRMPGYAQCRSSDVGDISRPNASIMQTVSSWVVPMVAWRVLSQRKQTSSCATERRPRSVPLLKGDCAVENCSAVEDCSESIQFLVEVRLLGLLCVHLEFKFTIDVTHKCILLCCSARCRVTARVLQLDMSALGRV